MKFQHHHLRPRDLDHVQNCILLLLCEEYYKFERVRIEDKRQGFFLLLLCYAMAYFLPKLLTRVLSLLMEIIEGELFSRIFQTYVESNICSSDKIDYYITD